MDNALLTTGIAVVSSGITFIFTRKRRAADTKAVEAATHINELNATEKAVSIWRGLTEELKAEVTELRGLVDALRVENLKLHSEIANLREELAEYKLKFI